MADYINRDSVIELSREYYSQGLKEKAVPVTAIRNIPSADVVERKHGEWKIEDITRYDLSYGGSAYEPVYRCSNCGFLTESYVRLDEPIMPEDADFPKYCGNCGARMDGTSNAQVMPSKDGGT